MQVIKKINNNVAVCLDNDLNELIAFGKGIGFPKMPYELESMREVDRTFYGIQPEYIKLINEIPEEIFLLTARIIDVVRSYLNCELNKNVVFTMADHIYFAIGQQKKGIIVKNPLIYEIQYFYEEEMELGKLIVKMINRELDVFLPKEEAGNLALHIINAEIKKEDDISLPNSEVIKEISDLVEKELGIKIDKDDFNYYRFVSHLQYLLKRKDIKQTISSENIKLYQKMVKEFPLIAECVIQINHYLQTKLNWELSEEEELYLMLHVNRLYKREDCNR